MSQIIDVLVCRPDGTQTLERREVPDDYFPPEPEPEPPETDYSEFLAGLMEGYIND